MNKKYYYGLFAAGMLFATSCSNDELTQVQSGEYAEVSISLGVEEVAGSRAISDGKGANELHYAVFDAQGKRIEGIKPVQDKVVTFPTTETLTLAKGQTYKVAFWAQNKDCKAYTVSSDMNVTVNYNGANNDDTRDAFFKTVEFTVNSSTALDVELKRPFAQINVGVDAADWDAAVASGVEIVNSKVTIKNAATSINLVTGKVSGSDAVNYVTAAIPSEELAANEGTYEWLSMSYILANDGSEAGDAETTLTSLAYTFYPKSGNPITFSEGLNNIPVRRNYRTNILGKILTGDVDFKISIDNSFDKPDYNHIYAGGSSANPERLEAAMAKINANPEANPVIKIPANSYVSWTTGAAIGSTPLVNAENEVTETVTIQGEGENSVLVVGGAGVGSLRAANGAKVIFKNMTIVDNSVSYAENAWEYTYLEFAGKLEFENVTFKGGIQLQAEDNDVLNATFKNCTFITEEESVYGVWVSDGTSTFSNCKFQGTRGLKMHEAYGSDITSVTIDGCEFGPLSKKPGVAIGDLNAGTTVTIKNSTFNGCQAGEQGLYIYETDTDVTAFNFTESNNIYINNNVATAEELAAALTAGVAKINVVLQNDIELPITSLGQITGGSGEYKLGGENTEDITIDLNGHKLNVTTTYWSAIGAKNDDALFTIKNGTMTSTGNSAGTWNAWDVRFSNCNYEFENVKFEKAVALDNVDRSTKMKDVTITDTHNTDTYGLWITAEGQKVTLEDCTIDMLPATDGRGIKIDNQYVAEADQKTVTLNIKDVTIKSDEKAAIVVKSVAGAEINVSNLNINEVAEDNINAVWVDKDASAYAEKVIVNGALKSVEGN